jgi:hypothetical protein
MSNKEEIPWTWGDGGQPPPPPPESKEGQRFLACGYDAEMKPFSDGDWIKHNDYAKLLHERIHDINQIGGLQEENARLNAEVERLTKKLAVADAEVFLLKSDLRAAKGDKPSV